MNDCITRLKQARIQPSAQRLAIAQYVLNTDEHPSAEDVWHTVRAGFPMVSRATVYNTLNLFVEKGLLRTYALTEGRIVFDPNTTEHHHFIDETTGAIEDIPKEALQVTQVAQLDHFDISECHVILRGKRKAL